MALTNSLEVLMSSRHSGVVACALLFDLLSLAGPVQAQPSGYLDDVVRAIWSRRSVVTDMVSEAAALAATKRAQSIRTLDDLAGAGYFISPATIRAAKAQSLSEYEPPEYLRLRTMSIDGFATPENMYTAASVISETECLALKNSLVVRRPSEIGEYLTYLAVAAAKSQLPEPPQRRLRSTAESLALMGKLVWNRKQFDEVGYRAYVANACGIP